MPKNLKDILAGVKSSKVVPGSTGSDPGVDYAPKAPDEQEFVKKHATEKHADRVGNGDDIYQATNIKHVLASPKEDKHGHKKPADKGVYEAKEQDKCNMTAEGTACPVHEMADCSKQKSLREIAKNPYAIGMAAAMKKTGDKPPLKKSTIVKAHDIAKSVAKEEVEQIDEISKELAGKYYSAAVKQHVKKVGMKPNMYDRIEKDMGKKRKEGMDRAHDRMTKEDLAQPLLGGDDESAEMAKTQLRALANKALHLAMQLNDDQVVEPWVQSKIAVAKDHVTAVHDYMVYGDHSKDKENEQTAPYDGSVDMSGAPRDTYPNFAADVNTGRNV